jgi:hypothetical protein
MQEATTAQIKILLSCRLMLDFGFLEASRTPLLRQTQHITTARYGGACEPSRPFSNFPNQAMLLERWTTQIISGVGWGL